MEDNRKHIDDAYREKLGNYTELPDAAAWESLSSKLQAEPVPAAGSIWLPWLWKLLAVLGILSVLFLGAMRLWHKANKPAGKNASDAVSTYNSSYINNTATHLNHTNRKTNTDNTNKASNPAISNADANNTQQQTVTNNNAVSKNNTTITPNTTTTSTNQNVPANTTASSAQNNTTKQSAANTGHNTAPAANNRKLKANTNNTSNPKPQNRLSNNNSDADATDNTTLSSAAINNNQTSTKSSASKTKQYAHNGAKPRAANKTMAHKNNTTPTVAAPASNTPTLTAPKQKKTAKQYNAKPKKSKQQTAKTENSSPDIIPATPPPAAKPDTENPTADAENITPADTNTHKTTATDTTTKQTLPDAANAEADTATTRKRKKLQWGYGAKAGYEIGTGDYKVNSLVLSPYIQLKITKKLSVLLQPTIKNATINKTELDATGKSYHDIKSSKTDSAHAIIPIGTDTMGQAIFGLIRNYLYSQTHDSIVAGQTAITAKTYYEFELPVLVQYEIIKHLHVYGGVSANFSKIVTVKEEQTRYENITRYDTLLYPVAALTSPAPAIPAASSRFSYNYAPYSQYTPAAQNPVSNPVRFSYMLGFNYEVWRRLSIDVLVQGLLSNPSYIPDARIRGIYSKPHVRLGLGFRINK